MLGRKLQEVVAGKSRARRLRALIGGASDLAKSRPRVVLPDIARDSHVERPHPTLPRGLLLL